MIIIHHLNFSRSTRILWLAEELQVPYEIVNHVRDSTMRAPTSLAAVHPLARSPLIEDRGLKLIESGAILEYLVANYGAPIMGPKQGDAEWPKFIEWLHFAEGSAMFPVISMAIGAQSGPMSEVDKSYHLPEWEKVCKYIESRLETESGYLVCRRFTAADIQMWYVLELARVVGLLRNNPTIIEYLTRLTERAAYRRAIARGGDVILPGIRQIAW